MSGDQIDIYDADLRPKGTKDWMAAHMDGDFHQSFHCWFYRLAPEPVMFFQLRSPHGNFPETFDITAAGHLDAGETVAEGVREIEEELGFSVEVGDLAFAGKRVEVADQDNGQKNREYQSVYFGELPLDLPRLRPDPKEVWGVYGLGVQDGLDLFANRVSQVSSNGIEYVEDSHEFVLKTRSVSVEDFLPRIQRYYLAALICVERIAEGRPDIAIS